MSAGVSEKAPDRGKDRKCFAAKHSSGVLHRQISAKLSKNSLLTPNYVSRNVGRVGLFHPAADFSHHTVHVNGLSTRGAPPPTASVIVDDYFTLSSELISQPVAHQPPFQHLATGVVKRFAIQLSALDQLLHHGGLRIQYMILNQGSSIHKACYYRFTNIVAVLMAIVRINKR